MKTALLTLAAFAIPFFSPCQEVKCKSSEKMAAEIEKYGTAPVESTSYSDQKKDLKSQNREYVSGNCEELYVIPVVFHVFKDGGSAVVPMAQIQSALDALNRDYNLENSDTSLIDPLFFDLKSKVNFKFTLAQLDPLGNPTSGVNYYPTDSGFGLTTMDATIASYAWDNYKYVNVYVMRDLYADGIHNNSGVAWYPYTSMSDAGTARIVYNDWYLGDYGLGTSIADAEFESVFTHEFGHFFNLIHTFEGGCTDPNDEVDDTPSTEVAVGCGPSVSSCGHFINGENYMDYNASCYRMFTVGQTDRVQDALYHPARITLWQKSNLIATGVIDEHPYGSGPYSNMNVSDTLIFEGDDVTFTDISCYFAEGRDWTFSGGSPGSSTAETVVVNYPTAGVYPAQLISNDSYGPGTTAIVNIHVVPLSSAGIDRNSAVKFTFIENYLKTNYDGHVVDLSGKKVAEYRQNELTDLNGLPDGVYLLYVPEIGQTVKIIKH